MSNVKSQKSPLKRNALGSAAALAMLGLVATEASAGGFEVAGYIGLNDGFASDITLEQDGTVVTFEDVDFDGSPFSNAPYWGGRINYWLDPLNVFAVGVEFTHGTAIADASVVGSDFRVLEFTDGLNTWMVNGIYKSRPGRLIRPYVGVGLGFAYPYVEVRSLPDAPIQTQTAEYTVTGVAAQAFGGVSIGLIAGVSVFAEYKLGLSSINSDLQGGGTIDTDIWTNQGLIGVSYKF